MYPLPSPQIRDTLEVAETEWSNPLGPTSKAGGFGEKIRTTVKDSEELPKLPATSRSAVTTSEEAEKHSDEATTDQTCNIPGLIRSKTFIGSTAVNKNLTIWASSSIFYLLSSLSPTEKNGFLLFYILLLSPHHEPRQY